MRREKDDAGLEPQGGGGASGTFSLQLCSCRWRLVQFCLNSRHPQTSDRLQCSGVSASRDLQSWATMWGPLAAAAPQYGASNFE